MRARPKETLQNRLRRLRLERRLLGFVEMLQFVQETEVWQAAPARCEQSQAKEGAHVGVGSLAATQAAPAHEVSIEGSAALANETKTSPAKEDMAQAALSKEGTAEATLVPANDEAYKAVPGTAHVGKAAAEAPDAARAALAPEQNPKASPAPPGR
ncbi:hypothetical protein MC885_008275 [Smutsia gigantea]|nr:hypothetical protein MC885_008275 [Smutsia gigantea]